MIDTKPWRPLETFSGYKVQMQNNLHLIISAPEQGSKKLQKLQQLGFWGILKMF